MTTTPSPAPQEVPPANQELITQMAEAFLRWPLPDSAWTDLCTTKPGPGRIGTNLLTFVEAKAMFDAIVSPALTATAKENERLRGKIGQLAVERDRLQEDLANAQASTIHTCHDNCQRVECGQRREIKDLSARLATAELALNEAREQWRMSSVCRELQGENERLKCMLNNAQREAAHLLQQLDDIGAPLPPHMRDAVQSQEKAPDSKERV